MQVYFIIKNIEHNFTQVVFKLPPVPRYLKTVNI